MAEGIKREDLYIVTKLWHQEKTDVEGALRACLKRLKLDYVDLYLVHWIAPPGDYGKLEFLPVSNQKVWEEMERMVGLGLTKSIGVSNAQIPILLDMMTYAKIKPVTN